MKKINVKKDLKSHVKANLALLHLQHLHPLLLALLLLQLLDQPLDARYCFLLIPSPCIHRLLHRRVEVEGAADADVGGYRLEKVLPTEASRVQKIIIQYGLCRSCA